MRVLHVGKFFPPHPGGIERSSADLCAALQARGIDTALLAHAEPGSAGSAWRTPQGAAVTLATCHGQWVYAPVSPGFPFLLRRLIGQFAPDLLHLHVPNTSALCALLLRGARRLPWVVHWHADIPLDSRRAALRAAYRVYRPWEQALLRRSDAIIATSAAYRDSSAALAPWRTKVHAIPLGIAPLAQDPAMAPAIAMAPATAGDGAGAAHGGERPLQILAVGRLSYFKGIDVLLRALCAVPAAALTVIGDGECRAALEALARDLGLGARVRFAGRYDMDAPGDAALAAAYAKSDVLCLPSIDRAESFGLVLLEAMRAGLPVVASAIAGSGVGFVVRAGETGLLVPPGDPDALARALRDVAADPALRRRLGTAGAQRWRDEFTLERSADRVLELYRQILAAPDRAAAAPAG